MPGVAARAPAAHPSASTVATTALARRRTRGTLGRGRTRGTLARRRAPASARRERARPPAGAAATGGPVRGFGGRRAFEFVRSGARMAAGPTGTRPREPSDAHPPSAEPSRCADRLRLIVGGPGPLLQEDRGCLEQPSATAAGTRRRVLSESGGRPGARRASGIERRRGDRTRVCGICGMLGFGERFDVSERTVVRMRDTLVHRGPDDAGAFADERARIALGHRRLSIVDLSAAGHQPMANEDETVWISYNGEVYNHGALRAELERRGHRFRSRTDTEAVLHLYEDEGPDCVTRLEGMFALAIWDARRRELFLARDRLGVKPLYYALCGSGLVFASEIRALLEHPGVPRDLDEAAFIDYLTFGFAPGTATMYRGVCRLAPAEWMLVRHDGSVTRSVYWSPFSEPVAADVRQMSEEALVTRLRDLLRESIRKRMMSDVPFGLFLSGGLDSSANVALMSELTDRPVRTFATAPRDHKRYDELHWARAVAQRFATEHHEVLVAVDDMLELLPRLAEHQDEPCADPTAVPQHFITSLARETGTIVVQCGEGSDEILHGYSGYATHRRYVVPFQRLPPSVREPLGRLAVQATRRLGRGIRQGEALYDAGRSSQPYWGGGLCFRGPVKARLLSRDEAQDRSHRVVERLWSEADRLGGSPDLLQKMTYLELKQRLPEMLLARLDRITMADSVEGREPFLDHRLVEFALALPPSMKHRSGVGKYALRRAMAGLLPEAVLSRPKQGFGTPMAEWLRGSFGAHAQAQIGRSSLLDRGLLDRSAIDQLFAAHRAGRGDWHKHLWTLYTACVWHDRWIARRAG